MTLLASNSAIRKNMPVVTGVLDYFPLAIAYVALVSKVGNDKHNPGEPLHWSRDKSNDHANCIGRHLIDRGQFADDGILHDGNLAWRALANLQLTLEDLAAQGIDIWALHRPTEFTATATVTSHGNETPERPDPYRNGGRS